MIFLGSFGPLATSCGEGQFRPILGSSENGLFLLFLMIFNHKVLLFVNVIHNINHINHFMIFGLFFGVPALRAGACSGRPLRASGQRGQILAFFMIFNHGF